jgi:ABC-2 type transport system permease protein
MTRTLRVAGKDLRTLWTTPLPYVAGAVFHALLGLLYVSQLQTRGQALIQPMFPLAGFLLLLIVPLLTMRSFAEELRTGALDLLVAVPVPPSILVAGKWLAGWVTTLVVLAPTSLFVVLLHLYGRPDPGPIEAGYLGLVLMASLLTGFGVFTSSFTSSQPVAATTAIFLALILWFATLGTQAIAASGVVAQLSLSERLRSFAGGAIDTGDLTFFVAATVIALVLAGAALRLRQIR